MGRIVIDVRSMERDRCQLKNILNRITRHLGGSYVLANLCEYENRKLTPIINTRPGDTIINCATSWSDIEQLIK
jgi:hypothetical protein